MDAFKKKTDESMDKVTRRTVIGLGISVINYNPVGTPATTGVAGYKGGHSRGNWQYGLNQIPANEIEGFDPSGSDTISHIIGSVPKKAGGHIHYIINNTSYIIPLERGSSQQAPQGMRDRTILDFQQIAREAIR